MQTEMSVTFCVTAPGRHPITLRPDGIYRFRCKPAPARSPVDAHLLADVWYSTKRDGTVRDHKSNEFFGVVGNAHAITIQPDPPTAIKIVSTLAADSSALQFIFGLRQLEPADDFRWTIVPSISRDYGYIVHPGLTVNVLRVKWPPSAAPIATPPESDSEDDLLYRTPPNSGDESEDGVTFGSPYASDSEARNAATGGTEEQEEADAEAERDQARKDRIPTYEERREKLKKVTNAAARQLGAGARASKPQGQAATETIPLGTQGDGDPFL